MPLALSKNTVQQQMSVVLTTLKDLNQAKAEATDSGERCTIKTETGAGTASEQGLNSSSHEKKSYYATTILFQKVCVIKPQRSCSRRSV